MDMARLIGDDDGDGTGSYSIHEDVGELRNRVLPELVAGGGSDAETGDGTGIITKCYPMAFFTSMGKVPDNYEDLLQRWRYRQNRPPDTTLTVMDETPFDEQVMKGEMIAMRQSLLKFADQVYTSSFKEVATNSGLSYSNGQRIVLDNDLKYAVLQLERSRENEVLVYKIFHHRMRTDKQWHVSIVDNWAASNNIHLLPPVDKLETAPGERTRNVAFNRQGFGAICLDARKNVLQRYMRPLINKKGWNIATTNKERQSKMVYTRKIATIEHQQQWYYVVEKAKSVSSVWVRFWCYAASFLSIDCFPFLFTGTRIF